MPLIGRSLHEVIKGLTVYSNQQEENNPVGGKMGKQYKWATHERGYLCYQKTCENLLYFCSDQ